MRKIFVSIYPSDEYVNIKFLRTYMNIQISLELIVFVITRIRLFSSNMTTCIDGYENGNIFESINPFSLHHKTSYFF